MKNTVIVAALLAVASLFAMGAVADDAADDVTIKKVMKAAMKDGLCKKVAKGDGTKAEAEELVELFTAMAAQKPPKGDADSWKAKTDALIAAAKACAAGEDGATAKLGAAANCKDCHGAHKGKKTNVLRRAIKTSTHRTMGRSVFIVRLLLRAWYERRS